MSEMIQSRVINKIEIIDQYNTRVHIILITIDKNGITIPSLYIRNETKLFKSK